MKKISKKKIIFLDIDGVLNVGIDGSDRYGQCFHKSFVENLQWIIEKTNCDIVISSTWKMKGLLELQEIWKYRGLPGNIIDITPNEVDIVDRDVCEFYDEVDRGHEIQQYIDDNKIKIYCIIDDVNDMLPNQQDRFVRTSNNKHSDCVDGYGLTVQCAEQVVEILNKNLVVNNEFISFEKDELFLKFKQEIEDAKHYYHYERKRLSADRSQILKDWLKTTQAIHKYPDLKNCITDEKLENITEKYNKYLFICKKLNETETVLSKEEFLIKEENPMYCVDWTNTLRFYQHLGFYEIHDKSTAKYFNSNTKELIEKEFELKWY